MTWQYHSGGIPEDLFIRGNVPITKTEIRVLSLSKLRLEKSSIALDIGSGTGSVTVEMALQCTEGKVIALDQNEEAVELTRKNREKFSLQNIQVIQGEAPKDLPELLFDRIFIGGTQNINETISYARDHLSRDGIIVSNAILLDSAYKILNVLEKNQFKNIECMCVNISKSQKVSGWMMKALNPIYIISAEK